MKYSDPEISPDGSHVAYVRSSGHEELYVIRTDGTGRRRLASGEFGNHVWSPDGTKLAFVADCGYSLEGGCRQARIDVIRRDGTERRMLLRPAKLGPEADIDLQGWSRRGELLYRVKSRGRSELYSLSAHGKPSLLAEARSEGGLGEAAWSPNGDEIAYKRGCTQFRSETMCDLAVMARDGSRARLLWGQKEPSGWPSYDAPTWVSDSNLLLVSLWGSHGQTRLLNPSKGTSRRVSKQAWRTIAVSANGGRVATIEDEIAGVDHIVVARPDGSIQTRSALPRRAVTYPDDPELWIH
jgi:Tol biopolymer transport system component